MFASQPIAVANNSTNDKVQSAGSPMSLTTGSFQNRFYPGGSPGQSLGPIAYVATFLFLSPSSHPFTAYQMPVHGHVLPPLPSQIMTW